MNTLQESEKKDLENLEPHVKESINLIAETQSLLQVSFSGGKDSTALLALFLLAKELGIIETFEVVHSNTLMEMPFLDSHVLRVQKWCESKGIKFVFLTAPMKDRFMYNVFGRGLAIPNRNFRWCTDRLKIKPIKKHLKSGIIMVTGERLGESSKRDIKLKKLGCSTSNECGVEAQKKITSDLLRPIINWSTCQVWDFIALMDIKGILPNVFSEISEIYSINQTEKGSMRTGCIGCPLVKKDKSLEAFTRLNTEYSALEKIHNIYENLTKEQNRLLRGQRLERKNKRLDGTALGAIKLSARLIAYRELLDIEASVKNYDPDFQMIQPQEKLEIKNLMDQHTYPRGYSLDDPQIIKDIEEYESLKQKDKFVITSKPLQVVTAKPFLKWAGGKQSLLDHLSSLLPKDITSYCEPFVGGGAMLFHLLTHHKCDRVMINDLNHDLILTYKVVRDHVTTLIAELSDLQSEYHKLETEDEKRSHFELIRSQFNLSAKGTHYSLYGIVKTLDQRFVTRAAQVIYLNKTCFNGLWRVRKSDGGFNTSFGKYVNPKICDAENLRAVSHLLQGVEMTCGSFENLKIDSDTFVYLDPPYLPVSDTSNFTGYSADGWGIEDAKRLKDWMLNLSIPDPMMDYTKIMLSSGVTDVWDDLTEDYFEVTELEAKRNINCKGDRRGEVKELVLRNYA